MWPAWIISTYICLSELSEPLACRLTDQYRQNCNWAPFDLHKYRIRIRTTGGLNLITRHWNRVRTTFTCLCETLVVELENYSFGLHSGIPEVIKVIKESYILYE